MENAADALKMAAAILIFIIALSVAFSIIGTTKQTADSIITMRDKQAYLESADLDGGILYTSSSNIKGESNNITDESSISGVTTNGDRIVKVEDIVSTIYRYSKEKYGVTIVKKDGKVLARFDSNTEQVMSQWYNIVDGVDSKNNTVTADDQKKLYAEKISNRIKNIYIENEIELNLEGLYTVGVKGNSTIKCGAPWYGNETEIQKRIACDLNGSKYIYNNQTYTGKNLLTELQNKKIVEITKETDNSTYLKDTDENGSDKTTDLLQQYEMPTVEIIYVILD